MTVLLMLTLIDDEKSSLLATDPAFRHPVMIHSDPEDEGQPLESLLLGTGATIAIIGRSEDNAWIVVEIPEHSSTWWVRTESIVNIEDMDNLPMFSIPKINALGAATPTFSAPAQVKELADLAIGPVFSRANLLVVTIANIGLADIDRAIFLVVDGSEPELVNVVGKPLRPGETLEAIPERQYVQRRASVSLKVTGGPELEEADFSNNYLEIVVEPDIPNDLEILSVQMRSTNRSPHSVQFEITLRNNSVIPLVGYATIAVRRTEPYRDLLGTFVATLDISSGDVQAFEETFDIELNEAALKADNVHVILSSDAINDANSSNNVFPR